MLDPVECEPNQIFLCGENSVSCHQLFRQDRLFAVRMVGDESGGKDRLDAMDSCLLNRRDVRVIH